MEHSSAQVCFGSIETPFITSVFKCAVVAWSYGAPYMPNTSKTLALSAKDRTRLFCELQHDGVLPLAGERIRDLSRPSTKAQYATLYMLSPYLAKRSGYAPNCDDDVSDRYDDDEVEEGGVSSSNSDEENDHGSSDNDE